MIFELTLEFFKQNKGLIIGTIILTIFYRMIQVIVIPKILARIFSNVKDIQLVQRYIILFLFAFGISKFLGFLASYLNKHIEPLLSEFITNKFVHGVFCKYRSTRKPVDVTIVVNKINALRSELEDLLYYLFTVLIPLTLSLIFATITVFFDNLILGMLVALSVIILMIMLYALPKLNFWTHEEDATFTYMEDVFQNAEYVVSSPYGIDCASNTLKSKLLGLKQMRLASINKSSRNTGIMYLLTFVTYSIAVFYLFRLYKKQKIKIVQFESNLLTIGRIYELAFDIIYYIPAMHRDLRMIQELSPFVEDLLKYCNDNKLIYEIPSGNSIVFENVTFGYGRTNIISDFSVNIPENSLVAVVGPIGSGKTTFINLIRGILLPVVGTVRIGDIDTSQMSPSSICRMFSVVSQSTTSLLSMSIRDNILFGLDPTKRDIQELQLTNLIKKYKLDEMYETDFLDIIVSKNGSSLSGGQRQVVHVLHAMLNSDVRVLILDEPTSALDQDSKAKMISIFKDIHKSGKTVVVITHDKEVSRECQMQISMEY
jgi:ABC-type multidrug transport system fused ATPase/permease subunit